MASYHDLLDAIARVRAGTHDREAWKQGLTGQDIAVACNPASAPAAIGAVLAKVSAAHPDVFLSDTTAQPQTQTHPQPQTRPHEVPPRVGEGQTAEAVRAAESVLRRQDTDAARVDLQVVTAVFNAHATHEKGAAELLELQHAIEASVRSRTDLDTPAGAREFQRFLIERLREIHDIVDNAGLDDSSKAALAAALAALYATATPEVAPTRGAQAPLSDPAPGEPERHPAAASGHQSAPDPAVNSIGEARSAFDDPMPQADLLGPLPERLPGDQPQYYGTPAPAAGLPAPPVPPTGGPAMTMPPWASGPAGIPPSGGIPGLGNTLSPDPFAGLSKPGPFDEGLRRAGGDLPDTTHGAAEDREASDGQVDDDPAAEDTESAGVPAGGDGATEPGPDLSAAIAAAVGGTPIDEAFRMQGVVLPVPGSPIGAPIDAATLAPGDIGVLTDRHALVLGADKVLLDGQIQPVTNVTGPGFIGWLHPPTVPTTAAPDAPAPIRAVPTAPS